MQAAAVIQKVGASDFSTGYLAETSNPVTLASGGSVHYKFINHNAGNGGNWLNWILVAAVDGQNKKVIRNDNWEDITGSNTGCSSNFNWDNFVAEMNGSSVDMTVSYSNGSLTMNSNISGSQGGNYNYSYEGTIEGNPNVVSLFLSVNGAYIEITEQTYDAPLDKNVSMDPVGKWDFTNWTSNTNTLRYSNGFSAWGNTSMTWVKLIYNDYTEILDQYSNALPETAGLLFLGEIGAYPSEKKIELRAQNSSVEIPVTAGQIVHVVGSSSGMQNVSITNGDISAINSYEINNYITAVEDGYMTLTQKRGNQKITLASISVYDPIAFFNPDGTEVTEQLGANLLDLEFNEPILKYPAGATKVVYSVSNKKLGVFDENTQYDGNVRFLNSGILTITATVTIGGKEYTKDYTVLIEVGDAAYEVNGNLFTLTGAGKLQERHITSIPCMTMTFGTQEADANGYVDVTIVRDESENGRDLVATTLADDGWRDALFTDGIPSQGTYYKFEPTADGTLNVYGFITTSNTATGNAGTAILYDATTETVVKTITVNHRAAADVTNVALSKDHEYYLFGTNPNYDNTLTTWSTYELHSFSFESLFRFDHPYEILAHNATSATLQRANGDSGSGVTYTTECRGGVSNASINGNTINFEGNNGAIIVTATMGEASIYYVITVPSTYEEETVYDFYTTGSNTLDNVQSYLEIGNYKETDTPNEAEFWAANYKVRTYTNRELTYMNGAALTVNKSIQGDNAKFIGKTAGLVMTASAKNFGTNAVSNVTYESTEGKESYEKDAIYRQMLYAPTSTLTPSRRVILYNGATFTIPQVPNNKFIKIWWTKRSETGVEQVNFNCTNGFKVYDLEGTEITTDFSMTKVNDYLELTQNREQINGVNVFKLEGTDGQYSDVTVNVKGGWVDIFRIEVVDNYDASMRIQRYYAGIGNRTQRVSNQSIVFTGDETSKTVNYYSGPNNSSGSKGHAYYYSVEAEGNISATLVAPEGGKTTGSSHTVTIRFDKGTGAGAHVGNVKITTIVKDYADQYVLDKLESWIPVGELETQTYPYTWDFTGASLGKTTAYDSNESVGADKYGKWKVADGIRQTTDDLTTEYDDFGKDLSQYKVKQIFALGSQLTVGGQTIEETKGLGILANATTSDAMNFVPAEVSTYNDEGLVFTHGENVLAPSITIPGLKAGSRIYVKANNAPEAVTGASAPEESDAAEGVYRYDVADAGDVVITFPQNENVVVYKIAVTDILKDVNHLGFASESRNHNIDHSLNTELTNHNVKAYAVTADDVVTDGYNAVKVNLTEANQFVVVPEGQGVVLWNGATDDSGKVFQQPLFYPAMHIDPTEADQALAAEGKNMMVGMPEGGSVGAYDGDFANYIMAYRHYTYDSNTGSNGDIVTENFEAFYPVMNAGSIGTNKAYLHIDKNLLPTPIWEGGSTGGSGVKNMIYIGYIPEGENPNDEPTGINFVDNNGVENLDNSVWYNLSGQKLNGRPATSGVYIVNGKKVMIK